MVKYIVIILLLCSCSATHHLNKFYKKGGKIERVPKLVTITDTLTVNGKDSIVFKTVKIECPEPIIKTRWKVRFDNRRFKDSLNSVRTQYKDSLRYALRNAKNTLKNEYKVIKSNDKTKRVETRQENKRSLWWLFFILGAVTMLLINFGIKYLKSYLFIR